MNKEIEKAIGKLKSDIAVLENYLNIRTNYKIVNTFENELIKDLYLAITALEAQQADAWIPISSDKPPKVNDGEWAVFIVPNYFGIMDNKITARYFKEQGIKHEEGWTDKRVGRATYWMPLTEPRKEEQP